MIYSKLYLTALLLFLLAHTTVAKETFYNVTDFGAKGDGKTNNSVAINAAIDAAAT